MTCIANPDWNPLGGVLSVVRPTCIHLLPRSVLYSFLLPRGHLLTHSFTRLFILVFARSFIHSHIHSLEHVRY